MNSNDVIVSDDSIFNALASGDAELLECGQLIIEFLAWRNHCKKILTIPKLYKKMHEQVMAHEELKAYFESFFDAEDFIGTSEKNPDEQEFSVLLSYLYCKGNLMIFVSTNTELRDKIVKQKVPRTVVKSIHEVRSFLQSKKEFWDFIFYKYYDSSA